MICYKCGKKVDDGDKFCRFCDIVKNKPEQKLYEDDKVCMFFNRTQIAYVHMQCIPKIHIKNINSLTYEHIPLLLYMKEIAIKFLTKKYNIESKIIIMGFHIPPFNSVEHLHMHCIIPPYTKNISTIKMCLNILYITKLAYLYEQSNHQM